MTGVSSRPGAYPEEGVPLICGDCGDWGVLDSKVEGGWRPPTFNERAEMLATFEFMLVLAAVRATIQRRET
jgi:hypothetical protein